MSIRRQIRLRKEFLHKKQLETQDSLINEKKRKLKNALEDGKAIPTEIVPEARKLQHLSELDVIDPDNKEDGTQTIDDEYAQIGLYDPKVCITTSRDPSSRLKQFAKEIKLCIPNSQAINRGTYRTDELITAAKGADFTDIIFLNETRGNPDNMIVCHLPYGPTAYFSLSNCVLRHDIPECTPASQAYPHLIIDGLTSKIGKRIGRILQALYPVPAKDSKRVLTFANKNDYLSFRHHMYRMEKGKAIISEAGPRFEMLPYEVKACSSINITQL